MPKWPSGTSRPSGTSWPGSTSWPGGADSIPLGAATWVNGGYWDLLSATGRNPGDVLTAGVASSAGSNVLSPVGSPELNGWAIAGNRCVALDGATQYLQCNAVAALANGADKVFSVALDIRVSGEGNVTLFGFGNSASGADNFVKLNLSSLKVLSVLKDAAAEATVTCTGTANLQYDRHTIVLSVNGTTVAVYVDGVADALDSSALDTLAIVVDRFIVGGFLANTATAYSEGYVARVAVSDQALSAGQAATLHAAWTATDVAGPFVSNAVKVLTAGDSITAAQHDAQWGPHGNQGGGGDRGRIVEYCLRNGMPVNMLGQFEMGSVPDRQTEGKSGFLLSSIANSVAAFYSGGGRPDVVMWVGGTNNVDSGSGGALTAYDAAIATIDGAIDGAGGTAAWQIVATIPPIMSPTAGFDQAPTFNANLPGKWTTRDGTHPTRPVTRLDFYTPQGGAAPIAGQYDGDDVHPNTAGYDARWLFNLAALRTFWRARSPRIADLTGWVNNPASGATVSQGSPVTVKVTVSRTDCSVELRTDLGAVAAMVPAAGIMTNTFTYSWTPQLADIGARSVYARVTDAAGFTVANTASVSVTVQASSFNPDSVAGLVCWLDMQDGATVTQGGGVCTAWQDKKNGITASEGSNPPTYDATGMNGHPCIIGNGSATGVGTMKLTSATAAALAAVFNGTNTSWCVHLVVEGVLLDSLGFIFSIASSTQSNRTVAFGQNNTGAGVWRVFKQDNAAASANWGAIATSSGVHALRFRSEAGMVYGSVDNGAESVLDMTALGVLSALDRFGIFARVDPSADTFASAKLGEVTVHDSALGSAGTPSQDAIDITDYLIDKWAP